MTVQGAQQLKLPAGVVGGTGITVTIQWPTAGVTLTGTTGITGTKRNLATGVKTALNGTMTATTAAAFTWKFGSNDVLTAGDYEVQFTAAFVLGNIVSAPSSWKVYAAIVV